MRSATQSKAIFICILGALFYLYDFVIRVITSTLSYVLMDQYHITAEGLGFLSSLFFVAYMIMQIPSGILYDRYGPRKLLTIMTFVSALSTYLFLSTNSVVIAGFSRFLMGFSTAFAYLGALMLATIWLKPRYFVLAVGLIQFLGSIGAIIGESAIAELVSRFGPQQAIYETALFGVLLGLLYLIFIEDYPPDKEQEYLKLRHNKYPLKKVLKLKQNWATAFYAFMIWAPISIFASLWAIPYLMEYYQITRVEASSMVAFIWIGIAFGGPILAWVSDSLKSRVKPLILASIIGIIASLFILFYPNPGKVHMSFFLFLYGFAGSAQAVTFGLVQDNNPKELMGAASGFNNMAIVLGGTLFQPLVGWFLILQWNGLIINNVEYYTHASYQKALIMLPLCYLVSLIVALTLIKETKNIAKS